MLLDIDQDRTFTVQDAAKFLSVTEESVLALIHRGELTASNVNTKPNAQRPRWRILSSDLGRFLLVILRFKRDHHFALQTIPVLVVC